MQAKEMALMFRFRARLVWTSSALLTAGLSACAALALYGAQATLPSGVAVADWAVGGMPYAVFAQELEARRARLAALQVRLAPADGSPAQARALGQLGLRTDDADIRARLRSLQEGSLWRRAVARWQLRDTVWPWPQAIAADALEKATRDAFPDIYARQPVDAKRVITAGDTIGYTAEARVQRLDEAGLLAQLQAALPSWGALEAEPVPLALQAPMRTAEPRITVQTLQAQGIVRKIAEFTTSYPPGINGEGRLHNVKSTAAAIQDVLLGPGEVFDYAPYIEQTEKQFGFKEAPVIVNGKLVPGIGGGICQVSSTLYNAVLRAGLAIVERRNHSLPVSYVPLGQDATFASGHIGFKFRNTTGHTLLIRTTADDRSLTVKLFGQTPEQLTYEIESTTVETLPPSVKYVSNPSLRPGRQETILKGKPGYVVETYRTTKDRGVVVSRERLSRDTYSAQPSVIAVNNGAAASDRSAPGPGDGTPLIEDGVKGPTFR